MAQGNASALETVRLMCGLAIIVSTDRGLCCPMASVVGQRLGAVVQNFSGLGVSNNLQVLIRPFVLDLQSVGPKGKTVGKARLGEEFDEPLRLGDPERNTSEPAARGNRCGQVLLKETKLRPAARTRCSSMGHHARCLIENVAAILAKDSCH